MTRAPDSETLRQLQADIETFLASLRHPVLVEDGCELLDLAAGEWRVALQPAGLVLEAWSAKRSVVRRIERLAWRDRSRIGLFVRKPGGRESAALELRELEAERTADRASRRVHFRCQSLALLRAHFPSSRFERVSNRSDREHSFSAWYTRGLMRQGRTGWAFLALNDDETPAASESALAYGLIWLDWLRAQSDRHPVLGLKLLLPEEAVAAACHRAAYLNCRAAQIEVWSLNQGRLAPVDLKDFGNLETRLARCPANAESLRRFSHEFDQLQPERWLESLILRDVTRVDPSLAPDCVYPQVPAFAGADRGVIDVLGVTRQGRLAVIELKLQEEINLLMQGLDYWLRVKWLNDRGQFRHYGYFPGLEVSPRPPLLYIVCPAFRFHSTFGRMTRYLDPCVEVIQVGLNDGWREGVRVLFRRKLNEAV